MSGFRRAEVNSARLFEAAGLSGPPAPPTASARKPSRTLMTFVMAVGALNAASLVGTALAFRWIDPASMGVWHTLLLASSYLTVVRLGILSGLGRELPFALGQGDSVRARRIAATALAFNTACSVLVAAAFLAALVFLWPRGAAWRLAVPAMAVISAVNLYLTYLQSTFRSDNDFARLARVHWVQAGLALLMPLFVYAWGFAGLCVHGVLQVLLVTALAHAWRPLRVRWRFDAGLARELLATGLPLFAASYLQTLAAGFDRVILLHQGGVPAVGYYAPAVAVLAAMAIVPGAVATYLYPRLSFALGQGRGAGELRRMALGGAALSVAVGLPLAIAGWMTAPGLIARFFPQYLASVPAVRWSLLAGVVWSLAPAAQLLGSLKAWRALWIYVGLLVAARATFPWLLARAYEPLAGVALGNLCAAGLAAVATLVLVWRSAAADKVVPA
ncbi:MAG TPA: oligosaccharide flippase family protein [Vicinamibacteria bacterium]